MEIIKANLAELVPHPDVPFAGTAQSAKAGEQSPLIVCDRELRVVFDVEEATQALLRNYLNGGSVGDAEKLKTAIENCLVNELGVSKGVI